MLPWDPTGLFAVKVITCFPRVISPSSCLAHIGSASTYLIILIFKYDIDYSFYNRLYSILYEIISLDFYRYLNQSTLVLGCGNITYTEEDDPVNDFFISDGHIMNGSGKFDEHVGAGYFD